MIFTTLGLALLSVVTGTIATVGTTAAIAAWMEESTGISGSINIESARAELGRRIQDNLNSGNYNTVSLEATVVDIQEQSGTTFVCFEVENDKYGIKSTQGTDLHVNDVLTLY